MKNKKIYKVELHDGPLDGLVFYSKNITFDFPIMLSFTFAVENKENICKVSHYSFLMQWLSKEENKNGAVYMHRETKEVKTLEK